MFLIKLTTRADLSPPSPTNRADRRCETAGGTLTETGLRLFGTAFSSTVTATPLTIPPEPTATGDTAPRLGRVSARAAWLSL